MSAAYNTRSQTQARAQASEVLRRRLDNLQETVPRFLFRGWSDGQCGGVVGLNTAQRITPYAFLNDPNPVQHLSTRDNPNALIDAHVDYRRDTPTEFSSWTSSWEHAVFYARMHGHSGCVSIIDRQSLDRRVDFYYVPDLHDMGLSSAIVQHEWLAHGPVEGRGLYCTPLSSLRNADSVMLQPALVERIGATLMQCPNTFTSHHLIKATQFASVMLSSSISDNSVLHRRSDPQPIFHFLFLTRLARLRYTMRFELTPGDFRAIDAHLLRVTGGNVSRDFASAFNRQFEGVAGAEQTRRLVRDLVRVIRNVRGRI